MAATEACPSESETNSKFILSAYGESLQGNIRRRYVEKIAAIGIDPFLIPQENCTPECLPPVESCDLLSYLVLDTSFYTKEQFKNFKSLLAYNHMVSGFITSVLGQTLRDKYVVLAKVRHSQRMNDPHVPLWIISTKEGTVLSAHCAGCMAGLGECCSHIASVLFYIEVWTRLNGKLACTQVKCTWLLPTTVKQVDYARIKEINFSSAKKLKADLDKSIETVAFPVVDSSPPSHTSTPKRQEVKMSSSLEPSAEEMDAFYHSLSECKIKPVCLSLIHPFADSFISSTRNIKAVTDLFDPKYLDLSYTDLLKECNKVQLNLSDEDIKSIERETVDQAKGSAFFRHRAGRVGASKCRAASHTDPSQPSQSLVKAICYPDIFRFSTAATRYGCKHEDIAIAEYEKTMRKTHANFVVTKCGTIINKKYQFLHATPDFLCECDCCGQGCGEVKCPYCIDGVDFDSYVQKKSSCLQKNESCFQLKRDHDYYYQAQQQIHTSGRGYLDFIVFASYGQTSKFFLERLTPDMKHWETQIPKLETFWRICILPEILGRWYTQKMDLKAQLSPEEVTKPGDCYCRETTSEAPITCANHTCKISKFHPSCLGIKNVTVPKMWYCPHCRKLTQFTRAKSKKLPEMKDQFLSEATKLATICTCQKKAQTNDKLLKCHNEQCSNGKFFHLSCMSYKRYPSNARTTWLCYNCKITAPKSRPSTPAQGNSDLVGEPAGTPDSVMSAPIINDSSSQSDNDLKADSPATPINISANTPQDSDVEGESSPNPDPDVLFVKETVNTNVNKTGSLGNLTEREFALIEDTHGWLDCSIIHQAQIYLKQLNPNIEGFQRPTLGPIRAFDIISGEFIQILNTGGNHWVCLSSIGCSSGHVNLYDSFFHDVVCDDIEEQARSLLGQDFRGINVVPIQQQLNGSDCGIFAIAFATSLVFMQDPLSINLISRKCVLTFQDV